MSELDFGSLNEVLAKNVAAENLARSIDAEYAEQFLGDAKAANAAIAAAGGTVRNLMLSAGPISDAYILGAEPVMLITGPGGSAKTTSSVKKSLVETQRIWPGGDGIRRYVLGVWRQKYVNLWDATIRSWWSIFPKDLAGSSWVGAPPRNAQHTIPFEDAFGRCELTAQFRAFGDTANPEDMKGNQFTDVYLNEMDTLPEELVMMLADRVGRDPPYQVIKRYGRIFGDGNAPNIENYCYRDFYENLKDGYKLFRQPGGREPGAENVAAMGRGYWEQSARINAHRPAWVRVMVDAKPGYLTASDPVYPKYDDTRNLATATIEPIKHLPIVVSIDGGNTPAAAYQQHMPNGQLRILAEIALERGGMRELATAMLAIEARRFADCDFYDVCDPSMNAGEETDDRGNVVAREDSQVAEGSDRQRLSEYLGRPVHLAKSQEVNRRVEAVACKFDLTLDGGVPGLLLDPSCKGLRRGFNQTFHWRRIAGTNDRGSIAKTFDGHVHEALQYGAMEAGSDGARVRRDERRRARQAARDKAAKVGRYNPLRRRA
jgi:hypothetical protein